MIAKALAHEAGLPFMATTGSELLNLAFLKTLFQRARKYAPSLVFIDEIDAIGSREAGGYDVVINQLLIELDGFDTSLSEPVFVVAATNLKDKLDPALIRAGRIDIHVEVPQLDRDARAHFVERYLALPHDGSLLRDTLLAQTSGMSGADLEQVRREAVLEMVRQDKSQVTQAMLLEQVNLQKYGPRSNTKRNDQHRAMTAYHEAGHAVMSMVLNPDVVIEQVTITARGDAGGFVSFEQNSEVNRRMTRQEFMDEICVLLAGRLAEQMKFGDDGISAGASSDLARATRLAEAAITQYGLDEKVGLVATAHLSASGQSGFEALVAERVAFWLLAAQERCNDELKVHWERLSSVAQALLELETLSVASLSELLQPSATK
jgi:ATP-dependent Zn protease